MAPKAKTVLRFPMGKPPSDSPPNTEEMSRDEVGSSKPSPSTPIKEQKAGSKKRKKEKEENGYPTSTEKKKPGARVFTDEDDIAILQGMIDSRLLIATKELHRSLKGKLSGDFSNSQLYEKIRRLKEKFVKNMERADSLKAHDALVFNLSNQIWSKDKVLVDSGADSNKKKKKVPRNSPMKVARPGKDGRRDSAKNKLREEVACLLKKYELKVEIAKLNYEEMTKG